VDIERNPTAFSSALEEGFAGPGLTGRCFKDPGQPNSPRAHALLLDYGGILHALPGIEHFRVPVTLAGGMVHPGRVLPERLCTTESLFSPPGRFQQAYGTAMALHNVSHHLTPGTCSFQCHDITAMSSSVGRGWHAPPHQLSADPHLLLER